jgi:hypothetical protein
MNEIKFLSRNAFFKVFESGNLNIVRLENFFNDFKIKFNGHTIIWGGIVSGEQQTIDLIKKNNYLNSETKLVIVQTTQHYDADLSAIISEIKFWQTELSIDEIKRIIKLKTFI